MPKRKKKSLEQIIYEVLEGRPFDVVSKDNEDSYSSYCSRVAETVAMKFEEVINAGD